MAGRSKIELPRSKRRYVFALTPLADAMFQLLIFFMLTSSLTPYSLLTLRSGPGQETAAGETQEPPPEDPGTPQEPAATWTIENGAVLAGGQRFGFDSLPNLAGILAQRDAPNVLIISTPRAQVQDIVTVLETLAAAQITSVQVVSLVEN
ncbi:MAG: biopolymer transporter ExbD [Aliishimia sp.]